MEYILVIMLRDDLTNIPSHPLPEGFSMRGFGEGDRRTWVQIENAAEPFIKITAETFDKEFGSDLPAMPRRCCFLVSPDGRDVGTITAWYERRYAGRRWGRIHWLAIIPEFQGRGLSKAMMTFAVERLRSLGHRRAILGTQTPRIAAIKTYLDFGFVPDMAAKDAPRAWSIVRDVLPHPILDEALK